jgi:hypothetical protein
MDSLLTQSIFGNPYNSNHRFRKLKELALIWGITPKYAHIEFANDIILKERGI